MTAPFAKLCVAGVGLIGGSFAAALRRQGLVKSVVGLGRGRANLEEAQRLGLIDSFTHDPAEAAAGADLIFLAVPVRSMAQLVLAMRETLSPGAVVTDAGSTKAGLIRALEPCLPAGVHWVPGHPIAGKETTGAAAFDPDLFANRWTILTPTARTDRAALARVKALWEACGAQVELMEPEAHDRMLGSISHLPHLVAYALVNTLVAEDDQSGLLRYSAGGFRDFTRIAASSPEMWRDICLENRAAILAAMDRYREAFDELGRQLAAGDGDALFSAFSAARRVRQRIGGAK